MITRAEIIEKVKARIDEISPFGSTELNPSIELIDKLLDDSDTEIRRILPIYLVRPSVFDSSSPIDNGDGTGYIVLPSNFIKLHSFKMNEWDRTLQAAISESSPKYPLQRNPVTRGGVVKPVVVVLWKDVSEGPTPSVGCLQNQVFIATDLQTAFYVTEFTLNDEYMVYAEGVLISAGHTRAGNTVIFSTGFAEGTEIIIVN